jgi:hypothetical protein
MNFLLTLWQFGFTYIVIMVIAVCGVLVGKALRDRKSGS